MLEDFLARALPAVERQQDDGGVDHEDVEGDLKHANLSSCLTGKLCRIGFNSLSSNELHQNCH